MGEEPLHAVEEIAAAEERSDRLDEVERAVAHIARGPGAEELEAAIAADPRQARVEPRRARAMDQRLDQERVAGDPSHLVAPVRLDVLEPIDPRRLIGEITEIG